MKRSHLLALLLICCLLMPLMGQAQERVTVPIPASSQLVYQGRLCLWSREGLTAVDELTGQTTLLAPKPAGLELQLMLSEGEQLYGLDIPNRLLYALALQDGQLIAGAPVRLQHEFLEDPKERDSWPVQSLILQGRLYLLYEPQGSGGWGRTLLCFDLNTGESLLAMVLHVMAIAADDRGRLLSLSLDLFTAANTPQEQDNMPGLMAYNAAGGFEEEELGQLQQPWRGDGMAMAWDKEDQSLLYVSEQKLYRRKSDGSEALLGQLLGFHASAGMTLQPLPGGRVSVILNDGVYLMDAKSLPEAASRALTVYGASDRNIAEAAAKGLQQTVDFREIDWNQSQELAQMLQAGSADIDVMVLASLHDELDRLVDKGYLLDLSQSPALKKHLRRCYPFATAPGQRGEAMYLLPVKLSTTALIARPKLFEQAGKALPDSFDGLCSFLDTWSREDIDRLSNLQPWAVESPRQALLQLALRTAFAAQRQAGEALSFDTPLMRQLLDAALRADTAPMEHADGDYSFMEKPPLMQSRNYSLTILTTSGQGSEEDAEEALLLPAVAGEPPVFPAEVQYLAIYARTPNQEAALRYLEAWLEALTHEDRVMLYPDFDEPLELDGMTRVLNRYAGEIAELEQQIAAASGAQKRELERQLATKREQMAGQEAMRYHLSPEIIQQYRQLMQHAVLADRSLNVGWGQADIRALLMRLKDRQIDLEQFIREAQGKLKLMQMEDR